MMRILLAFTFLFFPRALKRFCYARFFGYTLHKSADIGFSLVLVRKLVMGEHSKIGHLNVIKGVEEVFLGEAATIGNLNWISGFSLNAQSLHFAEQLERSPKLVVGEHAAITNRHLIDCTDAVTIGRYATFAGFRSQILTHSISIADSRQRSGPVVIGQYAFVGTASIILPDTCLPDFSVLGAGSVLNKKFIDEYCLYAGNPARFIHKLDHNAGYFNRKSGFVI